MPLLFFKKKTKRRREENEQAPLRALHLNFTSLSLGHSFSSLHFPERERERERIGLAIRALDDVAGSILLLFSHPLGSLKENFQNSMPVSARLAAKVYDKYPDNPEYEIENSNFQENSMRLWRDSHREGTKALFDL